MTSAKLPEVRLRHMLENIDGIIATTAGMSPSEVSESFLAVRAVERSIQIISEAAKELPPKLRLLAPEIPWRDIIGIGNLLRHEYYRIRDNDLWMILRVHLPQLRPVVVTLLSGFGTDKRA